MTLFLTILHVSLCFLLVAIVLLQHGKGADLGVMLGSGGSQTVFGARGAGNFLTKLTTAAAVLFMLTSLLLSYAGTSRSPTNLLKSAVPSEAPAPARAAGPPAPAVPAPDASESTDVPAGFEEIPSPPSAGEAP